MALVPTIRVWTTGEIVLASYMTNNINGPLSFLLAPPIFRGRQTVAQSVNTSVFTPLTFDVEDVDTAGGHSTVTNTSRYASVYTGWYLCSGGFSFVSNATGTRAGYFRMDGVAVNGTQSNGASSGGASTSNFCMSSEPIFLNVTDFVELLAFQSSGAALLTAVSADQQSRMNCLWVSN